MKAILYLTIILFSILARAQVNPESDFFLVPFEAAGKWGLSDTLMKIKVNPVYDDVTDCIILKRDKQSYYFFKRGDKLTLIDYSGKEYLEKFDSITVAKDRGLLIYRGYVYSKGKVGLYNINPKSTIDPISIVVPPIYDAIEPLNDKYVLQLQGKKGLLEFYKDQANTVFEVKYDSIEFENDTYKASLQGETDIYPRIYDNTPSPTGSVINDKKNTSNENLKLQERQQLETLISNLKRDVDKNDLQKILPIQLSPINNYIIYRENGLYGHVYYEYISQGNKKKLIKNVVIPAEFDTIIEITKYKRIVKKNGRYGLLELKSYILEPNYEAITIISNKSLNQLLVKDSGKYAIYSLGKRKFMTEFEFDDYELLLNTELNHSVILKKGDKVGLWNGNSILIDFDDIDIEYKALPDIYRNYSGSTIKYKKNNRWGVVSFDDPGKVIVPFEFDSINQNHWRFYLTKKKALVGLYGADGIRIDTKYKSIRLFKAVAEDPKDIYYIFEGISKTGKKVLMDKRGKEFHK